TDDFVSGRITPTLPPAAPAAVEAAPPAVDAAGAAALEVELSSLEPPHAATTAAIATRHPAASAVRCFTRPIPLLLGSTGVALVRWLDKLIRSFTDVKILLTRFRESRRAAAGRGRARACRPPATAGSAPPGGGSPLRRAPAPGRPARTRGRRTATTWPRGTASSARRARGERATDRAGCRTRRARAPRGRAG